MPRSHPGLHKQRAHDLDKQNQSIPNNRVVSDLHFLLSSAYYCTMCAFPSLQANRHLDRGESQNISSLTPGCCLGEAAPWQVCMMTLLSRREIPNRLKEGSVAEQIAILPARHLKEIALSAQIVADIHHRPSRSRSSVWELGRRDYGLDGATCDLFVYCETGDSCNQNLTL